MEKKSEIQIFLDRLKTDPNSVENELSESFKSKRAELFETLQRKFADQDKRSSPSSFPAYFRSSALNTDSLIEHPYWIRPAWVQDDLKIRHAAASSYGEKAGIFIGFDSPTKINLSVEPFFNSSSDPGFLIIHWSVDQYNPRGWMFKIKKNLPNGETQIVDIKLDGDWGGEVFLDSNMLGFSPVWSPIEYTFIPQ